jgi:hypothetical protein
MDPLVTHRDFFSNKSFEGELLEKRVRFCNISKKCRHWTLVAVAIIGCLVALFGIGFGICGMCNTSILPAQLANALGTVGFYGNLFIFTTGCLFTLATFALMIYLAKENSKHVRKEELLMRLNQTGPL